MPFSCAAEDAIDIGLCFIRPELVQFIEYWNNKRNGRSFPARADISPRDFEKLLPWVHMYDVVETTPVADIDLTGGKDFRIRLAGTGLAEFFTGGNYLGNSISLLPSPTSERLRQHLNRVLQERAPIRSYNKNTSIPEKQRHATEGCYAPLSSDGNNIDMIIGITLLHSGK